MGKKVPSVLFCNRFSVFTAIVQPVGTTKRKAMRFIISVVVVGALVPGVASGFVATPPRQGRTAADNNGLPGRTSSGAAAATTTMLLRAASDGYAIPSTRNRLTSDPELLKSCSHNFSAPLAPSLDHVRCCSMAMVETSLLPSSDETDNAVYVFPLLVTPKNYTSNFCLRGFMKANRDWVDDMILQVGTIMSREFTESEP